MERKNAQTIQKLCLMLSIILGTYNISTCCSCCPIKTDKDANVKNTEITQEKKEELPETQKVVVQDESAKNGDEDMFDNDDDFDFSDLYESLSDEEKAEFDKEIAEAKKEQEEFEAMTSEEQEEYIKTKYADWEDDFDFDDLEETKEDKKK